ncbi:MAG: hypothetical protein QN125_08020 [Armatimonadota bacterium]|nr:hypothetical protein [Armatimonadota bacterium]
MNIAKEFVSPLRQAKGQSVRVTYHKQPEVAQRMVRHVRGLPIRETIGGVGLDAYATIVVECDNQGEATPWTDSPAPQPGDADHYDEFVKRIAQLYEERFGG